MAPRLLQPPEEEVGTAEQQHFRQGRVALGQRGQVLVDDRLEQAGADQRRQEAGSRAGEEDAVVARRQPGFGLHALEKFGDLLGLTRVVALIVLPADLAVLLDHRRLDGGGADVDADEVHDFFSSLEKGAPPPSRLPCVHAGPPAPPPSPLPCELARRPIFDATWRTSLAAVPAAAPACGIR